MVPRNTESIYIYMKVSPASRCTRRSADKRLLITVVGGSSLFTRLSHTGTALCAWSNKQCPPVRGKPDIQRLAIVGMRYSLTITITSMHDNAHTFSHPRPQQAGGTDAPRKLAIPSAHQPVKPQTRKGAHRAFGDTPPLLRPRRVARSLSPATTSSTLA